MRVGSCFAGIGGFDLGLQAAGFDLQWQVELTAYGRAVLARHWPEVARFEDMTVVSTHVLKGVDLICGGFPCQDISIAGLKAGLDGERSRLWFEMLRVVRATRPRWVLVENSPALRTNGADIVLGGLEEAGYTCWPLVVGAWAVGAPHRRERVWIVGYAGEQRSAAPDGGLPARRYRTDYAGDLADAGLAGREGRGLERILNPEWQARGSDADGRGGEVEHAAGEGLERPGKRLPRRWPVSPVEPQPNWEPARTVKLKVGRGADGVPTRLAERRRRRELEALGEAVVPQIPEAIGRAILAVEQQLANERFNTATDLARLMA